MSWSRQALWICFLWLFSLSGVNAAIPACNAIFPDGASSNSNGGKIKLEWSAKVTGSPDNILSTKRLDDRSGGNSCNTVACGSSGSAAPSLDYNTFPNNNNDVEIGYNETRTLLPGDYDDIRLNSDATATLSPGDYRLRGTLHLRSNAQIRINGSGVVRIFLKGNGRFESGSDINAGGDASRLIIFSRGEVSINSNATVTGFVYAQKSLRLYNRAVVNGAISGKDVELRSSSSRVNYLASAASDAAFGDLCGGGDITPPEPPPAASGCAAVWPDGVQSHSNDGEVKFEWRSQVINSPDNIIDAVEIDDDSGGVSCGNTTCTASFSPSTALDFDDFKSSGGSDFKVEYKQSRSISPGTYKKIELKGQATLTMAAGDYYVTDDVKLKWDSRIVLPSSGVVRMFIRKKFESEGRGKINASGNPEQLLILAKEDVKFKNTDDVKALIYSLKEVELGHGSDVVGAVSGKEVKLKSSASSVTYDADAVTSAQFGEICSGGPAVSPDPIAEYRFDECKVEGTLKDETETYNATPRNVTTEDGGVIGKALDLSATGTRDWVDLPRSMFNGLNDFSIALWIKTSTSKSQQEILQALGSNTDDDELEIYLINSSRVRLQVQDEDVNLDSRSSLTDGRWHHLVLTRKGNRGCLYVDGALQECENGLRSGALSVPRDAVVLGQEQDSYGGSFSSSQAFEGFMDELKVYNKTLSDSSVTTLHTNELAGNNGDGEARTPLGCDKNMVCETYRDNFSAAQFDNNDGSIDWMSSWNEFDRSGNGATRGDIFINNSNGSLRVTGRDNYVSNNWIERRFSGKDYDEATLKFAYDPSSGLESADKMIVELSTNGGSSYTQLDVLQGLNDGAARSYSRDLTRYLSDEMRVRLRVYPDDGSRDCCFGPSDEYIEFDAFEVEVCREEELQPIADLRFDEARWRGVAGEIKDTSGNNNHASIVDQVSGVASSDHVTNIKEGKICRAGHVDDNNSADSIFAIDSGIDLNALGDQHTVSFWYRPTDAWNDGITRILMDASGTTGSQIYYYLSKESDRKVEFGLENTVDGDYRQKSSAGFNFAADTWVHLATTVDHTTDTMKAYVNGVKVLERSTTGTLGDIFSLYFGDNRSAYTAGPGTGRSANGDFDEVLIFNQAMPDDQIASIYRNQNDEKNWDGTERECPIQAVDHYGIEAPSPVLTCEAAEVVITAYDDQDNPIIPDEGTVVTISADKALDSWSLKSGSGTFRPISAKKAEYEFDGLESELTINLINTDAETVDLDVTDVTDVTVIAPEAQGGIEFADVAFSFASIDPQISGKDSASINLIGRQTNPENGQCSNITGQTAQVGFAYQCVNPGTCANPAPTMTIEGNSSGIAVGQGALDTAASFTTVELTFGEDGIAPFKLNYTDAGKVKLFAAAHVSNAGDTDTKTWVEGTSNEFVVKPVGLCIEATDSDSACASQDASCSAFVSAGTPFELKVSARQWQSDSDSDVCDNGNTPNFKLSNIDLTHDVLAPSPVDPADKVTGNLGVSEVSIASLGSVTANQTIDEVGVFEITIDKLTYLGEEIPASSSGPIGRFYPDHFVLSGSLMTERSDIGTCTSDFSYMGENFQASFTLTAQNTSGAQTENYADNFAKLDKLSELGLVLINNPVSTDPNWASRLVMNDSDLDWPSVNDADANAGQHLVQLELALDRGASLDGPYDALTVAVAPDDGDAQLKSASFDTDTSGDGANDHASVSDPTEIRYGRMQIQNTYGPETSALNQPIFIQYFDGTGFVTNTDDSCTAVSTGNITLQEDGESALAQGVVTNVPVGSGTTDLTLGANTIAAGEANLTYTPTGAGNTGTLTMTYDVPAWLEFNWSASSNDPSATVTFGRYRGSDRVIYWLEQ